MKSPIFFLNTDATILDLIKKGDEEALVVLYRLNRRMVTSYVLRNSGTEDDAEDLLQESIVILWERVRSGRYVFTSKISTFIFATVKNLWYRRLARLKKEPPTDFSDHDESDGGISQLDEMIESELSRHIAAAFVKLGDPCKTLLMLFYWEECSMEEIAVRMKFANAKTAKSKKYQCKKAMEKILIDERII